MISPPPHMQSPMSARPGPDQPPWASGPTGHRFPPPSATSGGTFTSPRPMAPPSGATPFRPGGPFPPGHPGADHAHMRPPTAPHAQMGFHHHPQRKEIPFPPDSVEAVTPILAKRKRLAAKDIGASKGFCPTELNNFVEDYNSSRVGFVCRVSPNLNMGLFPNALS